jgi:hypothetical protein
MIKTAKKIIPVLSAVIKNNYLVLDRKPHEGEFSSNRTASNFLNLYWFLNQQSTIANQQ